MVETPDTLAGSCCTKCNNSICEKGSCQVFLDCSFRLYTRLLPELKARRGIRHLKFKLWKKLCEYLAWQK